MEETDNLYKSEPTLGEKVDKLTELVEGGVIEKKKVKKFRMPFRGKVNKSRLKRGYVTVVEISENNVINFRREQMKDNTIKMGDTFHAVDSEDCLIYKGKPLLIIPKKSDVPYSPNRVENNTFKQKHIMSRMMNETLENTKAKLGGLGMSIGAAILIGVVAYAFIAG